MMDGRKKKVLSILCMGSLFLVWQVYGVFKKYVLAKVEANQTVTPVDFSSRQGGGGEARRADGMAQVWERQAAVASEPWGRDPFGDVRGAFRGGSPAETDASASGGVRRPDPPPLRLTGVSRSHDRWLAVVGSRIVRVGDVIGQRYTVIEISEHSITVVAGGWAFRYELGSEEAVVRPLSEEQ